ncbi:phosphatase PAP2 family protein [Halorubrum lacusprofundi]|jgi:membrane-associated phospholipid phosphatase|uniref:Phosphoesterase PA-phosphatase related n=1 Tax=Halorubrum lacusprofundi (strain ATCC 49239 / DSM 5036 / JCM 8891 / ACAM 34) TaxID=416348 RepID=B9LQY6_HALLT|nr:phosphatase PAP2 family protein [Halorubrum lacusprofundi]ACM55738.1 phosphoesterase PA-phosphatase related [Halorubrum lacusprofundi ATCC 49239]MCG1007207.1 phosphatase PAP2 family protein [Halorubrum lacusprofundi]
MSRLLSVVSSLAVWVGAALLVASVAIIGPRRLYALWDDLRDRLWEIQRPLAALVIVLIASAVGRGSLQTVSELFGLQLTWAIYALEGNFVAWVQATFGSPELTVYFSAVYVYGYVFLLAFPFLAYLALPRTTTLKRLVVAYALNYAIGLVLYTVVLAYGPRNVMPDMVTPLLFTHNPGIMALTGEINEATNVFPSLHTSLSVTVGTFAVLTRREYPLWTPIAAWLAVSVVIATMYLGIHWLTDVIGGTALALGAVYLSYRLVDEDGSDSGAVRE